MKKLMSCLALSLALSACDPEIKSSAIDSVSQKLSQPVITRFGLDGLSLSLSPVSDLDPNSDCSFVDGVTSSGVARFLQQKPAELCRSKRYRTCSMTSIVAAPPANLTGDVKFVTELGWKKAKTRDESLRIDLLAIRDAGVTPAATSMLVKSDGQVTKFEQRLSNWRGATAIAAVYRVVVPCDGTAESMTETSDMILTRAELQTL